MRAIGLSSTTISTIGYDEADRTLFVTFANGRRYTYDAVPRAIVDALIAAPSIGAFFNAHVRDRFEGRRADGRKTYPLES